MIYKSRKATVLPFGITLAFLYGCFFTAPTVIARIVSSLYNYFVNRKIVFESQAGIGKTLVKYYGLCIMQMLISAFFVTKIYSFFSVAEVGIKIVVDTVLFFMSYQIQRRWIFR